MSNTTYFTNSKFQVLSCLYDARGIDNVSRITQQEIANKLNLSRVTINGIFQTLRDDGYLTKYEYGVSNHALTEKAVLAVEMFRMADLERKEDN